MTTTQSIRQGVAADMRAYNQGLISTIADAEKLNRKSDRFPFEEKEKIRTRVKEAKGLLDALEKLIK